MEEGAEEEVEDWSCLLVFEQLLPPLPFVTLGDSLLNRGDVGRYFVFIG